MMACWIDRAEVAQDDSHPKDGIAWDNKDLIHIISNFETARGHGCWHIEIVLKFQSSKMVGNQHWHVQQTGQRWPSTLIHVHGCNRSGPHGLKLVRYKTKEFETPALLPREDAVASWGKLSNGEYTGGYNLQAQKCGDKIWPTFPSDFTMETKFIISGFICFDQCSATPGL